jgi:hypothetical protein
MCARRSPEEPRRSGAVDIMPSGNGRPRHCAKGASVLSPESWRPRRFAPARDWSPHGPARGSRCSVARNIRHRSGTDLSAKRFWGASVSRPAIDSGQDETCNQGRAGFRRPGAAVSGITGQKKSMLTLAELLAARAAAQIAIARHDDHQTKGSAEHIQRMQTSFESSMKCCGK